MKITFENKSVSSSKMDFSFSTGFYPARICGFIRELGEWDGKPKEGARFIVAASDDNDRVKFFLTNSMTMCFSDRSNFTKILAGVLGCACSGKAVYEAGVKAGIFDAEGNTTDKFLDISCAALIRMVPSKKDPSMVRAQIDTLAPASPRNPALDPEKVPSKLPLWLKESKFAQFIDAEICPRYSWYDGVKEEVSKPVEPKAEPAVEETDDLPF